MLVKGASGNRMCYTYLFHFLMSKALMIYKKFLYCVISFCVILFCYLYILNCSFSFSCSTLANTIYIVQCPFPSLYYAIWLILKSGIDVLV